MHERNPSDGGGLNSSFRPPGKNSGVWVGGEGGSSHPLTICPPLFKVVSQNEDAPPLTNNARRLMARPIPPDFRSRVVASSSAGMEKGLAGPDQKDIERLSGQPLLNDEPPFDSKSKAFAAAKPTTLTVSGPGGDRLVAWGVPDPASLGFGRGVTITGGDLVFHWWRSPSLGRPPPPSPSLLPPHRPFSAALSSAPVGWLACPRGLGRIAGCAASSKGRERLHTSEAGGKKAACEIRLAPLCTAYSRCRIQSVPPPPPLSLTNILLYRAALKGPLVGEGGGGRGGGGRTPGRAGSPSVANFWPNIPGGPGGGPSSRFCPGWVGRMSWICFNHVIISVPCLFPGGGRLAPRAVLALAPVTR